MNCRKKQAETRKGVTLHRCLNRKSEHYKNHVVNEQCAVCPVIVRLKNAEIEPPKSLPVLDTSDYPTCEFRAPLPNKVMCGVTGLTVDKDVCTRCVKDSKDATAGLFNKAVNYANSIRKWIAAGRPERSDERVQEIFDNHCSKCSMFDRERKVCNSCGCPATTDQPAIRNKLKMATEECPLGQFPAEEY